ncbi:helix-turn-helix domain-containing protein [Clostridium sp. Cult2]|uniref:helix-turn-helix domain-containing protein n=1 Tax=Clostridium sp. Cult2 TaxID=2079003 RepID=UPI001F172E09|nr:helix-turn-helix transcriptional regulator [Clostridium sp. Cult2]MCF6464756.1 transcriptional regulator [Clostridium sp. Cult2]
MGYSYDKLWKLLIDKKMNREELRKRTGMSSTTLARMGKDQNVSLDVLGRICKELECDIGDIISYKEE